MLNPKNFLLVSVIALTSHQVGATHYFVSNKGNDINNGTSKGTPWLSLQMISKNAELFHPGDSIFLERGSTFREQLDISSSGIYVGAYGEGSNPIISGSTPIKDWALYKKNIWRARCKDCTTAPENLFVNNRTQPLGRYPNTGYLSVSSTSQSLATFSDNTMQFPDGYWNKSEVVVRSSRWTLDNLVVASYSGKTFSLTKPASYPLQTDFGYFIQKHLATLDRPGEWYFNPETKEVFLYLNSAANPNTLTIEASTIAIGLNVMMADDLTVENIELNNQQVTGIRTNTTNHIKFSCITVSNAGKNGIEILASSNPRVENCLIVGSNNNGVEWRNNSGGVFTNNTIRNTGMNAGRGVNGNGNYIGLNIASENNTKESLFQYNTIDSTGYIGIDFRAGNISIKNNSITSFCLRKDDGAAIYTWGNTLGNNIIEDNIIDNGIGAGEGSVNSNQLFASGIYIDDRSSQVQIIGNTVSHCATAGIFLHNAKDITVTNNILIGNGTSIANKEKGQLYIKLDTLGKLGGNTAIQLIVSYNLFIVERDAAYCVYVSSDKDEDLLQLGTFNLNQYRANHTYQAIGKSSNQLGMCLAPEEYTLTEWQEESKYDEGSTFKKLTSDESISSLVSRNLINNGNMTTNTDGWMAWPQMSAVAHEKDKIIDGPCLKVNVANDKGETLVYHSGFALDKNKLYRLTFSAMSSDLTKIEFVPLMANTPWQSLGDHTCFAVDATYRTYTYFFKPASDCSQARVNFKGTQTFWIDNVSLNEIIETVASRE